jgi:hypothetical protein
VILLLYVVGRSWNSDLLILSVHNDNLMGLGDLYRGFEQKGSRPQSSYASFVLHAGESARELECTHRERE